MKNFKKVIKSMVIVFMMLIFLYTVWLILNRVFIYSGKDVNFSEVYERMNSLKNVTITRKVIVIPKEDHDKEIVVYNPTTHDRTYYASAEDENTYEYIYNFDVENRYGTGDYKYSGYSNKELVKSTEEKYYFVFNGSKYYYYYRNNWGKSLDHIYLDDYDYILYLINNIKKIKKIDDNKYEVEIKFMPFDKYETYYNFVYVNDDLFPKLIGSLVQNTSDEVKITIDINDEKYITNILVDLSKLVGYDCSYSISYSNFNDAKVDIPASLLSKLNDIK